MIKVLSVLKYVFFPIAFVVWGVSFTDYAPWFEEHWHTLVGTTVGTGFAGVDTVETFQQTALTYNFGHDIYLVGMATFKAACIVAVSLGTTKAFKKLFPDAKPTK